MSIILHITTNEAWRAAESAGSLQPDSLASEGFIHCSTPAQVLLPANELFIGRQDLILLAIEPEKLSEPLVYEDCYDSGQQFPHVYGPLNIDAVTATFAFPPNRDGSFSLPAALVAQLHT